MSRQTDDVLEECGLSLDDVAASAARVFSAVLKKGEVDGEDLGPGWPAVALRSSAMFSAAEDDLSLSFSQFADMLRRAYARGHGQEDAGEEYAKLPATVRVGWEAVARHMANVFSFEPQEARQLASHEERISAWGLARLAG